MSPMFRCFSVGALALAAFSATLAGPVTTPKEFFGFDVCEDYQMFNYTKLVGYWQQLAKDSKRIKLVNLGKTEEGRDQWMAVVSDPSNLANLERHRKAAQELAAAKSWETEAEALKHIKDMKAMVWIDGGIHSTETLAHQQLAESVYRLVSRETEENRRFLKDCIILLPHINPDGHELVADWYMRKPDPKSRSLAGLPRLYQKYAGHDNNRDWYQMNLAETRNVNKALYLDWLPQMMFNHHQSAPNGTIMYLPPFRNPYNNNIDPLIQVSTDLVGLHMHQRLISEGKGGSVMKDGASFSAWWNGGLRTTTYFHNMIGILAETWGSPGPTEAPFIKSRQVSTTDLPLPLTPGLWRMRQSLEYVQTANDAFIDYASRYRVRLLYHVWRAARNSVERGQKDTWSRPANRIQELGEKALSDPNLRDPRLYVIPQDQPDFPTAQKFADLLRRTGVEVHVATEAAEGIKPGDLLVRTDQAYRPHILDLFEPQDHPNSFRYEGGPPIAPYDSAGYTPAFQMAVRFDRRLEPISVKSEAWKGPEGFRVVPGLPKTDGPVTLYARAEQNDSHAAAFHALKQGLSVSRDSSGGFWIEGKGAEIARLTTAMKSGEAKVASGSSSSEAKPMKLPRVGLWDAYGGSMASGWTRWLFDEFGIPYEVIFAPEINRSGLIEKYDAIFVVGGGIPASDPRTEEGRLSDDETIPWRLRRQMGAMSVTKSVAALKQFAEEGGHLITVGSSSRNLLRHIELPVQNALVGPSGAPWTNNEFFIPGSLLRVRLNKGPLNLGVPEELDMMFDESPAWKLAQGADSSGWVGGYVGSKPLRSGWAWGQEKLEGSAAILDFPLGRGRVVLFGPEVVYRGQQHGAFKLIFNALWRSASS